MFGVCVRCVYGIEEYAVAEYAADFVDLPASVTHLSYDSVITPRDRAAVSISSEGERAESGDDVLNMSSTNEVSFWGLLYILLIGCTTGLIDENRTSGGVLIVDFYANWCQPCVAMKTNLQVVENHYKPGKLVIHKVDVDENQELCNDYEISALPTLIFFSRGNIVKRVKGLVDVGSLMQMIDEILDQSS
ncbi:putative thioredoxin [Babesia divergens]|uniref:Thioredoxin n=1 Tax=Babesia divergens TaxID=32595 RepID=A0AAD9GKX7_BABDI|nr:putative thioredoxin [Babesia divergens]